MPGNQSWAPRKQARISGRAHMAPRRIRGDFGVREADAGG